jgi:hypothetical protein
MCGNGPWGFIIGGLIVAGAMIASAYFPGAAHHAIQLPHLVMEISPLTIDVDLADARVTLDVSL